jgi:phage baseplate assembly protein W
MIPNILKIDSGERTLRNYFGSLFFPFIQTKPIAPWQRED